MLLSRLTQPPITQGKNAVFALSIARSAWKVAVIDVKINIRLCSVVYFTSFVVYTVTHVNGHPPQKTVEFIKYGDYEL